MSEDADIGHNSVKDWAEAMPYIERAENVQADIDKIMEDARKACEPHREDMKQIKTEAADAGYHKREFAAVLRERRLISKANAIREKLTDEQESNYDSIRAAIGMLEELPLGQAALAKAA